MKTFGLNEAAAFLRCHPEELRRRAKAGIIPGAKVGRAWVFLEDDLAAYLRSLYPQLPASVASDSEKGDGMSLRKRGGIWWIDVVAPNGERIRRTTGTANKALAQEFHDRLKAELWRIAQAGREAAADLERGGGAVAEGAVAQGDGRAKTSPSCAGSIGTWAARTWTPSAAPLIDRITDAKLAQGVSNATVNRTLEVGARDSAQVRQRMGMAGPGAQGADAEGAHAPHSFPDAARKRSGCLPRCRSIWRTWRRSRSRRDCGRPTSPVCSGRRWIWCGGWRGFIPIRPRRGKAIAGAAQCGGGGR